MVTVTVRVEDTSAGGSPRLVEWVIPVRASGDNPAFAGR